jgi:hypothetical protein
MRFSFIHSHIITNITNIMEVVWLGAQDGFHQKSNKKQEQELQKSELQGRQTVVAIIQGRSIIQG